MRSALFLLVVAGIGLAFRVGTPAEASTSAAATDTSTAAGPGVTPSYYMASARRDKATRLGCSNRRTSGRMSLFFGAPTSVRGGYGATLWGGADLSTAQIGELVKDFVRGYAWCRTSGQQLLIGMGTSNSTIDRRNEVWIVGHGKAWGTAVRDVAGWADRYYPGVAKVYGAWDAEPSWSKPRNAELWMQGYNAVPGRRPIHDHFSADGCPRDKASGGACNNGWSQYHLWRLAWQYDPALPMPQIYATTGVNARQWQKIDEYGARVHHDGMVFPGVMSQAAACRQARGCARVDNTPTQARTLMLRYLNLHPLTRQARLDTVTDMAWHR